MKTKFLKVSLLILAFSLVIGAAVATVISANETEPAKPEIYSQNIQVSEKFALIYAVDAAGIEGPVTFRLYDADPANGGVRPIRAYEVSEVTPTTDLVYAPKKDSYICVTDGFAATAMLTEVYVQAEANGVKSDIKKYSVAEYLYERLATIGITDKQVKFYNSAIKFGASAQKALGVNTDNLVSDYCYVSVENGTINGSAYSAGVYKQGTEITPAFASEATKWNIASHYKDWAPQITKNATGAFEIKEGVTVVEMSEGAVSAVRKNADTLDTIQAGASGTLSYNSTNDAAGKRNSYSPKFVESYFTSSNGTANYSFVNDTERKTVAKLSFGYGARPTIWNHNVYDPATDKAFEISFDVKFGTTYAEGAAQIADERIRIEFMNELGTISGVYLSVFANYQNADYIIKGDVNTKEWFNIRFVVYDTELTTMYCYVNGEYWSTKAVSWVTSLDQIKGLGFYHYLTDCTADVYVDNLFIGYTSETK